MTKRGSCLLLAAVMMFSLAVPAFAEEAPLETPIPTEEPVVTEEPVEATEVPVEATEVPVEATEVPVEATEVPVEATEDPVEVTEAPVELTEGPAATETPVETTEEPAVAEEPAEPEIADEPMMAANVASGDCSAAGSNVKWSVSADGVITISGTGKMYDYTSPSFLPWVEYSGYNNGSASEEGFIKSVVVEPGVTYLGNYAFAGCRSAASVTLPATLTEIGHDAFSGCRSLTSIVIPEGVTRIAECAFRYCTSLASITLPTSLTSIGSYAFDSTPWLKAQGDFVVVNGWLYLYQGTASSVTVPSSVRVLSGQYSFPTETLQELILPETVTEVGGFCFNECPNLRTVTIYNPKAKISMMFDRTCPTSPETLEIRSYNRSEAQTYVNIYGTHEDLTFTNLGPAPTPIPTATPVPTATPAPTATPVPTATPKPTPEPDVKPAKPAKPTVKNTTSGVKISWKAVSGAAKYRVYYKTTGGWKKLTDTTKTSYTWTKAKSGTKYTFTIKAYSAGGKASSYDKTGKSITYVKTPNAPTVKKVSNGIKITWSKVTGATKYRVYYKIGNGSWKTLVKSTTKRTYTWKAPKNGVKYTFTVRAYKGSAYSSYNTKGKSITYRK